MVRRADRRATCRWWRRPACPTTRAHDESLDEVDSFVGLPTGALTAAQSENAEIFVPELGKWLEVRSRYLNWVDGRLAQMVIATDITPRRHAEEQSAAQAERAQSASRLITMGEMASSVAHELNQPLTAINNYCNGLVSRIKGKQINEEDLLAALDKTARQAQRAGQIIQRIRSLREAQRAQPHAVRRGADGQRGGGTGRDRAAPAQRAPVALRGGAPAEADGRPDPDRAGAGEPAEERRRVDRPWPTARSRAAASSCACVPKQVDEQAVVEFSVLDSGAGLAPEVMDRLYEAFFSTKVEGMGIGLNLCRTIVESHQGRMQAENIYNGTEVAGCRFSFWIPVSGATNSDSKQGRRGDCMSLIPKKGTVYVVDDDEAVRDSLQWLLEGKDYRVRCFDSAESFLSRYDPREVACLIVDIRMGGMTGLELQDRLLERKSPLPIVFITGHGDVPMAVNTMKKGAMDFIQKPFKEDELVSLVERMLEHAKGAFAEYQSAASRDALLSKLTSREAQVLERIVAGRLNKQIADDLGISIKTVEAHRANIMEKLNANTVADLLKIALGQNAPKA